jgi:anti-sigma-K factor RskA
MAMSMPAEALQLLVAGYVLGDLSSEEAAAFEQLLASDPAIAAEVMQLQSSLEMAYAPAEVAPSAELRSRILENAQISAAPPTNAPIANLSSRPKFPIRGVLEVAAVGIIAALGIQNYRLSQTLQISQAETQHYAALTYELQSTTANQQASAKVVVNPKTLEGKLLVQNLPPVPPGKVYVLWTVLQPKAPFTKDAKDAVLTQVFQVNTQGQVTQPIALPAAFRTQAQVVKVAVTIEEAQSPQNHIGKPILIAQL